MDGFVESFTYDAVNHLETTTKDKGNAPLSITYMTGVNDHMDTKSDAATYNYPDISKNKVDNISSLKSLFLHYPLT